MEPLAHVKSVDDDIQAMWERLDSKYGDPAKVADAIINSIQNVKCIKEGEHKKFIQFVNVIEEGYRDLCNLKLEKEITTTSSISIIEKRLPPDVMKEWARLVSNDTSTIDKTDKFPSLLRFLLNLKRALEYQNAELRLSSEKIKGSVNHTDKKDDNPVEQQRNTKQNRQCLIHENGNHWTSECRVYLSKPIEEKEKIVKEKGACWSCLRRGHGSQQCRSKRICNVNNCKRTHHSTLHQEKKVEPSPKQEETPPSVSGTASVCDSTDVDTCLLQIQKIRSPKGWVDVLWDNGASLSFITNAKAEAEKLRGTTNELSQKKGPDFLKLPESAWPITRTYTQQHANVITHTKPDEAVNDSLAKRINIDRFSTYNKLIHTTARILAMYNKTHKMTFKNASRPLTPDDISKAETFWIHGFHSESDLASYSLKLFWQLTLQWLSGARSIRTKHIIIVSRFS